MLKNRRFSTLSTEFSTVEKPFFRFYRRKGSAFNAVIQKISTAFMTFPHKICGKVIIHFLCIFFFYMHSLAFGEGINGDFFR